jgi:hypothetical protein
MTPKGNFASAAPMPAPAPILYTRGSAEGEDDSWFSRCVPVLLYLRERNAQATISASLQNAKRSVGTTRRKYCQESTTRLRTTITNTILKLALSQ